MTLSIIAFALFNDVATQVYNIADGHFPAYATIDFSIAIKTDAGLGPRPSVCCTDFVHISYFTQVKTKLAKTTWQRL